MSRRIEGQGNSKLSRRFLDGEAYQRHLKAIHLDFGDDEDHYPGNENIFTLRKSGTAAGGFRCKHTTKIYKSKIVISQHKLCQRL
jgi:hypothetical protein